MRIGLIDVDGTLPNLALMKLSAWHKSQGDDVEFALPIGNYDHVYAITIFTRSRAMCEELLAWYGERISIGGTGWDVTGRLPEEVEHMRPDYDLYRAEDIVPRMRGIMTKAARMRKAQTIVDAGIGFTSRGCVRNCGFCFVPRKEGMLQQATPIAEIINPRSNVIILCDNNLTADPLCIEKLHEIRDRRLVVDINQGFDVRLMTPEIAQAMSEVKMLRSVHYAWDLMKFEKQVMDGIRVLGEFVRPYRQLCFMLVGYDTSFDDDMYRFRRLTELGISPYVMVYNEADDAKLHHFERWVNGRFCKACSFDEYLPWVKAQNVTKCHDDYGALMN